MTNTTAPAANDAPHSQEVRMSRRELEEMFEKYNSRQLRQVHEAAYDPAISRGHSALRKLALIASAALLAGFALGLYTLSVEGGETTPGKALNKLLSGLWRTTATLVAAPETPAAANFAVTGKPVRTLSLTVANAQGGLQTGIPLKLALSPPDQATGTVVKVTGVPVDSVLTAGKRASGGVWLLTPDDLSNVALVLSSQPRQPLVLQLEVVSRKTGELLSPSRQIKIALRAS